MERCSMKGHALFYLCFLLVFCAFGHKKDIHKKDIQIKDISGTYYNESGFRIEIFGNEFNCIVTHPHARFWSIDTLAKCTFKWIDDSFIELNTPLPDIVGNEGLKVVQSADSSSSLDSIKLSFLIPNQWDLKITVSTNTLQNFDFIYSKINRELSLPNNIESFSFHIAPTRLIAHLIAHSINCFYGAVGFDSLREYQIEKNTNHISIEIPALDDAFFDRWFIKGEYAKVTKNTITWKGEVFRKKWEL